MAEDDYLLPPKNQKFYRMHAYSMGLLGLNSHHWPWFEYPPSKFYAIQRMVVIIFMPIALCSMILYLSLNYKYHPFTTLASMFSTIPYAVTLTCKVMTAQTEIYKTVQIEFMDKIHLHNFYTQHFHPEKNNFIRDLLIKAEKNTRNALYSITSVGTICVTSWTFFPIMHNFQHNDSIHNITTRLELGVYFFLPFDYENTFKGHVVAQIIVVYCSYVAASIWVFFDSMNVGYICHLVGHIKIFRYDLEVGQNISLSNAEWEKELKRLTATYYLITKTFKNVETAFGLNIACVYGQNLVQGGVLLYMFTSSGSDVTILLTYGLMIPIFMGTLMVLSVVLEDVRIQADDIPVLVYALPWEDMNVSNRKLLLQLLFQVQPTLEYIAAFNIKAGVNPAVNILKTTFSYYVMIKSRQEVQ